MAERNAYEELVKDITPKKTTDEPFASYKDQLGFGNIFISMLKANLFIQNGIHSLDHHDVAHTQGQLDQGFIFKV